MVFIRSRILVIFYEVDYMQEIDALGRAPYDFFLKTAKNLPPEKLYSLLGALNVKYISSFSPLPEGEIELVRHFPEYPLWLYWVEQAVPRVYVVPVTEHETDPVKTLERLASKDFDRFANVILDQPISLPNQAGFQAEARFEGVRESGSEYPSFTESARHAGFSGLLLSRVECLCEWATSKSLSGESVFSRCAAVLGHAHS